MTKVKICGLTNRDDTLAACDYGADLLGFITVAESPRFVGLQEQWDITVDLPPFVHKVAVSQHWHEAGEYDADFGQFYADTPEELLKVADIRCFRIKDESSLAEIRAYPRPVKAILLDTYHKDKLGGSGETFNWELAIEAKKLTKLPIILAGGLTPENVQDALNAVRPYAVDVASGVESAPGIKDHAKVRAFIQAVREWDLKWAH